MWENGKRKKKRTRRTQLFPSPFPFQPPVPVSPVCNAVLCEHCLRAESILATRERAQTLHGADALGVLLLGGERAAHRTGELRAQVERDVLLALVELAQLLCLGLVDDRQHARNVLAGLTDLHQLRRSTASDLRNAEGRELRLEVMELLQKLGLRLCAQFGRLDLGCVLQKKQETREKSSSCKEVRQRVCVGERGEKEQTHDGLMKKKKQEKTHNNKKGQKEKKKKEKNKKEKKKRGTKKSLL